MFIKADEEVEEEEKKARETLGKRGGSQRRGRMSREEAMKRFDTDGDGVPNRYESSPTTTEINGVSYVATIARSGSMLMLRARREGRHSGGRGSAGTRKRNGCPSTPEETRSRGR